MTLAASPHLTAESDLAERDLRLRRLRESLAAADADTLLAYGPAWRRENVRYLVNAPIRGDASFALLSADGTITAFSSRDSDLPRLRAAGWVDDAHLIGAALSQLVSRLRDIAPRRLAIAQMELVPESVMATLRGALAPRTDIISGTAQMEHVRLTKSPWEIERHRAAARVCDLGWKRFVEVLEPGLPEYHITAEVEACLKIAGAEDNFMLMASGGDQVRGMVPPGNRRLAEHDLVRTELTPQLGGYWTQICRSAVVGAPTDAQKASFDLFSQALQAGLDALHAGVTCHEVARAENQVFERQGFGEYCGSSWTRVRGHNLGTHLDESPVAEGNHTVLPAGAVLIVHPNTFTPLAGYHVLGEPVVVTETGYERLLSTDVRLFSSKENAA